MINWSSINDFLFIILSVFAIVAVYATGIALRRFVNRFFYKKQLEENSK